MKMGEEGTKSEMNNELQLETEHPSPNEHDEDPNKLTWKIDDKPPIALSLILGFQVRIGDQRP